MSVKSTFVIRDTPSDLPPQKSKKYNTYITKFRGIYNFLTDTARCNCYVGRERYTSVARAIAAAKCLDPYMRNKIAFADKFDKNDFIYSPRTDWITIRDEMIYSILFSKYSIFTSSLTPEKDYTMRDKLMETEDLILIFMNQWHDNELGVCTCAKCNGTKGLNILGIQTMRVREFFKTCTRREEFDELTRCKRWQNDQLLSR